MEQKVLYQGFEQGPIRPPSEADSLLIRVTRNCPWNRCAFCPVYKGSHFSIRPVEHVLKDIEQIAKSIQFIKFHLGKDVCRIEEIRSALNDLNVDVLAFNCALNWYRSGMHSIFLQDANSLVVPTEKLLTILKSMKEHFPNVQRITSYARAQTVYKKSLDELIQLKEMGLNRIHIGLESGSDMVLNLMHKGVTKQQHIEAGQKVMKSGIELSEYYMPGLGGRNYREEHAIESADALNQINPTFIRLRTLAIPLNTPLYKEWESGQFKKCSEEEVVQEILCFVQHLDGITSIIKSDHILNLLPEIEGKLPEDKPKMTSVIEKFLSFSPEEKLIYKVGRRIGVFNKLEELYSEKRYLVEQIIQTYNITQENIEEIINQTMSQML